MDTLGPKAGFNTPESPLCLVDVDDTIACIVHAESQDMRRLEAEHVRPAREDPHRPTPGCECYLLVMRKPQHDSDHVSDVDVDLDWCLD